MRKKLLVLLLMLALEMGTAGPALAASGAAQKLPYPVSVLQAAAQMKRTGYGEWGHFFGGMSTGALLAPVVGQMLHPFGGSGHGFSPAGLLFDVALGGLIFWLVRRFMRR